MAGLCPRLRKYPAYAHEREDFMYRLCPHLRKGLFRILLHHRITPQKYPAYTHINHHQPSHPAPYPLTPNR
ncbi:hypothetical protein BBIA_2503 [Bifidobacterium biavatii DSM 23969]|uniref:Uncharacterized protein n=1 Tax=Bifidobacterium biavatii DSM 23969 TaxID=1437608 RepID=A0A086ZL55_9BIFI|nr:hypothetical protein BBIA_2503 [Bifidobacterium biavatii DSM 23969]